ncbi:MULTISPECIES: LLM class flavin-dependent oxidoreductase [Curtobacterium]|uniref:LLM class flavin-dependent oxidoreductase n=1 Tax=Curtobacterium TaxID=2034 RepID=UPI0008F93F03|nr:MULTISPECIES: LLM class flavin-dependent oxidoreductase [Curtobacterium]MBO9047596.1 LLM class flavin-dependent oxidoreductase [Curtobacterium flaccumfaciens pv. flaccumfaciens]MBO9050378.1 LLM class flavin-dependent oxidoreductase [Curtobacterium flaccumfaciens pv. flaccumfaciens]MBO9056925.1 LLM class flavin-dependent oxidoreductase [Curtobacterium flaccumfaciens pv. flaccumfaciens]MBT1671593.1 LLM class flavin-dependent oxidoreductase [Curtobacterium flaccumfaciens pv. flaccumfaciens]MCS
MTTSSEHRQIRFNAFDMNCVAHQSSGLWRHPRDRSRDYRDLTYWTDLAKTLERGAFDGIFIADVLGTYDVYGGSNEAALRTGSQVPVNDPILLVSAMASVTEHLGFGITAGTAYEHPYPFARRMSTLDHLTKGRVGWNVVTGYLPSAARNMGQTDQLSHDDRYDVADEYLEVLYKLWEGSWEDDAVVADREAGVFTDPAKVHPIEHHGTHFDVPGIHLSEPSVQRTPVIYQAGASPRGIRFAAENAEAVFVGAPTVEQLASTVAKVRDALEAAGRDRYAARVYTLLTVITDATDELAQAKYEDYLSYASELGALVLNSGWMGVDLSQWDPDQPLGDVESNAIQSAAANIAAATGEDGSKWTIRDLARQTAIGGLGPVAVGGGATIADRLQEIQELTDVDGFNLAYAVTPGTWEDVIEFVIPELRARGAYPEEYEPGSLRQKLHGRGDRLPDEHRGASFRIGSRAVVG